MDQLELTGQTIDGKYQLIRELGRGGMGTVYLATHLGTERPVALKIIAPQYMKRPEFVERFRREARAAGRLRHPNVVNVTDFGFAETRDGQVAYLVMEYLDGCTLGEILDEEKNLPVGWTLDILDQVCSAVHEAHLQGIIHRDLKPDNIWLEPNQRGGYTVKVLDFGIAKLEEHDANLRGDDTEGIRASSPTHTGGASPTYGGLENEATVADGVSPTLVSEAATIAQIGGHGTNSPLRPVQEGIANTEMATMLYDSGSGIEAEPDTISTRLISGSPENAESQRFASTGSGYAPMNSAELTRVGAVLGTPLYMSPEQCRGERLDPRSDIYSLGVIAYQMLSGAPPFEGDYKDVMESHKIAEPPPLKAKNVRKKLKRAIVSSLSKDPASRPPSAEAFINLLRSRSEGIFGLLRRSLVIYSEHLPKFLLLTAFFELPVIAITLLQIAFSFLRASNIIPGIVAEGSIGVIVAILSIVSAFCATLIIASIVWIVTQYLAVPLRPVRIRPAIFELRRKWKKIAATGVISSIAPFVAAAIGFIAGFIVVGGITKVIGMAAGIDLSAPIVGAVGALVVAVVCFFVVYVWCILVSPVVMMESAGIRQAFRRSKQLANRAFATALAATLIMFLIPVTMAAVLSLMVSTTSQAIDPSINQPVETSRSKNELTLSSDGPSATKEKDEPNFRFGLGGRPSVEFSDKNADVPTMIKHSILESLIQIIWLPIQIFVLSFSAIIVALLYLKTRLAGGESLGDWVKRFEDDGRPMKKWQKRVRQRLIQSGRISSNA